MSDRPDYPRFTGRAISEKEWDSPISGADPSFIPPAYISNRKTRSERRDSLESNDSTNHVSPQQVVSQDVPTDTQPQHLPFFLHYPTLATPRRTREKSDFIVDNHTLMTREAQIFLGFFSLNSRPLRIVSPKLASQVYRMPTNVRQSLQRVAKDGLELTSASKERTFRITVDRKAFDIEEDEKDQVASFANDMLRSNRWKEMLPVKEEYAEDALIFLRWVKTYI